MSPDRPSPRRVGLTGPASRRAVLAGVGSLALVGTAGCLGGLASGADDRRYAGYDRADLIPWRDAFPDGWEERPDLNEQFVV